MSRRKTTAGQPKIQREVKTEERTVIQERIRTKLSLVFVGVLALESAAFVQMLGVDKQSFDVPLFITLACFAISLPTLGLSIYVLELERLYGNTLKFKHEDTLAAISLTSGFFGIIGIFAHFSILLGALFFIVTLISFLAWFSFELQVRRRLFNKKCK